MGVPGLGKRERRGAAGPCGGLGLLPALREVPFWEPTSRRSDGAGLRAAGRAQLPACAVPTQRRARGPSLTNAPPTAVGPDSSARLPGAGASAVGNLHQREERRLERPGGARAAGGRGLGGPVGGHRSGWGREELEDQKTLFGWVGGLSGLEAA